MDKLIMLNDTGGLSPTLMSGIPAGMGKRALRCRIRVREATGLGL